MFTATLFTIAKILKQPKYPLIDEWIKRINRKEYYSVIKKKKGHLAIHVHRVTLLHEEVINDHKLSGKNLLQLPQQSFL